MEISVIKYPRPGSVRLIDEKGQQIGVMSCKEAFNIAVERGFELIEVAPQAKPPVCKLGDYGKLMYQQSKKQKPPKATPRKEIRMSVRIGDNDLLTKVRWAEEFLSKGHEVLVSVQMKGRERQQTNTAVALLHRFVDRVVGGPFSSGSSATKQMKVKILREISDQGGKVETLLVRG